MSKHREQNQASTLQDVRELLGEVRKYDNGVWVGKNYSLGQLKQDIKAIADKAEGKLGMHEGAWRALITKQDDLDSDLQDIISRNVSSLYED